MFTPQPKMTTAAQLQDELEKQRAIHAPYLADHAPALESLRTRIVLDAFDWRIETESDRQKFERVLTGQGEWKRVQIPHYGEPLGKAVTYYRTTFRLTSVDFENGAIFVHFKGVDYKAHAFLNGTYLGSHEGFFAPFEFDLTPHACMGENVLVVRVENDYIFMGSATPDDPRRLSGDKLYAATGPGYDEPKIGWHHCPPAMGIYQDVFIETRPRLFIHDIFVRPLPDEQRAEAWIELYNCDIEPQPVIVDLSVYGQNFKQEVFRGLKYEPATSREIGIGDGLEETKRRAAGELNAPVYLHMEKGVNFLRIPFAMPDFRWWEPDEPWLYQLQVKILDGEGAVIDSGRRQFGMRTFRMDTKKEPKGGLYFNNRQIRLRGANTMGHLQQCVMKKDWAQLRDDILLAKICNMNFLRLTQRPVQPEIYDYCDKLGLMVQTDLPLFGVLRRNRFCEALRQAEEMERLVRPHASTVMVSYINEPFPNANNAPHRNLQRPELEDFFTAADLTVRLSNPDRVIKHVDGDYDPPSDSLPDNHCYTTWYNGSGVDIGELHKGYWQPVKPGWYYGCGEFGAEGLDSLDVMYKYYPPEWLPQEGREAEWSPTNITSAQSGNFHYFFYETPRTLAGWVESSRAYQGWATRFMTEALRRNRLMTTFAIHLFIDAFPASWMKAIMDVERQPKPAFFAYREGLTPLLANLRTDRFTYFVGDEVKVEAWICNDLHEVHDGASLRYQVERGDTIIAGGQKTAEVPACSTQFQGIIKFDAPDVAERTMLKIRLGLVAPDGTVLHDTDLDVEVFPPIDPLPLQTAVVLGAPDGEAAELAEEMKMTCVDVSQIDDASLILIDDYQAFLTYREQVTSRVKEGANALFFDLSEGTYNIAGSRTTVKFSSMLPLHFVSRDTSHRLVEGFRSTDFKHWYDVGADMIRPILINTFIGDDFAPVLLSGNTNDEGEWEPVLAVGEKRMGQGSIYVCQIHLNGRTAANPVARLFAKRITT